MCLNTVLAVWLVIHQAKKEYSFTVHNCGYINESRGLGTKQYEDVGDRISAD